MPLPYQVPYRSPGGLYVRRSYNPLSLGDASTPSTCPTRSYWWLVLAAAAGGGLAFYAAKPKRGGGR
jgi:hypothetical protein